MDTPTQEASTSSISENQSPSEKSFYGRRNWKKWVVIYIIIGVLLYAAIYYFVFAKQGQKPYSTTYPQPTTTTQPKTNQTSQVSPHDFVVIGHSMMPNFQDRQVWLYESYINVLPNRYDVVLFEHPQAPENIIGKRVIGLPDEKVKIIKGGVYINNQLLQESYVATPPFTGTLSDKQFTHEGEELLIPPDSYFVLGDNRINSSDSRIWGFLKKDKIIGKLTTQIQPLDIAQDKCTCWDSKNAICLPQIACQ